ncbi:MAG: phosphopantetheine-binding protein [Anaerolineae bacterium]|nr:phosphopantetheine-binding protein [Anaerolineae bacterium]
MAFKITLNGANYVDARRRQAFEAALVEGRSQSSHLGGNGHTANAAEKPPVAPVRAAATAVQAEGSIPPAAVVVQDYDRVLDGLERGLAKSYDHQSETLRVHQQYLSNQAAYASIYAQLMQEQGTLFSGDAPISGQSDVLLQILQSLSRSVEQFHEHQSETLTVHSQFLDQQSTYAQAFVDLLQTHYGAALTGGGTLAGTGNGNGHGNGHHPVPGVPARVSTPRLPVTAIEPTLVVAPRSEVPVETARAGAAAQIATPAPAPVTDGAPLGAPAGQPVGAPVGVEELGNALLEIVSEKTGYPAEMLELEMDMEADLGIDSIKRVEILGALQDDYPSLPDVETDALAELRTLGSILEYMTAQTADSEQSVAADAEAASDVLAVAVPEQAVDATSADLATSGLESLGDELLAIVSDKTGYPAEMLELEMDMEADLGIDSIKRVEILGALQDQHPDLPDVETEALAELRTLAQILDYMKDGAAAKKA